MKLFTKIALGLAGFFFSVAMICFVIAFAMGVTASDVKTMIRDGKFSFGPEDGFHITIWGDNDMTIHFPGESKVENENAINHYDDKTYSSNSMGEHEVPHVCTILNVKLGAGKVDIYYDDVPYVQVKHKNIPGFAITTSDVEQSVSIRGDLNAIDTSDASLTIILPRDVKLEKAYLEIGASEANITDMVAEEVTFVVGAGAANLSDLVVGDFDIKVGAGEAIVKNLSVRDLDIETGVGEVNIEIAGAEADYSYKVDCGIGEVVVGSSTFGGIGGSEKVTNMDAINEMDIECGIGSVHVQFGCNITDGTCDDAFHNHSYHHNNHGNHE